MELSELDLSITRALSKFLTPWSLRIVDDYCMSGQLMSVIEVKVFRDTITRKAVSDSHSLRGIDNLFPSS